MSWKMKSSNRRNGGPLFTLGNLFYGPAGPSRRQLRSSAAASDSSERNASSSRMLSGHAVDSVSKRSDSSSEDGSSSVLSSSFRRSRSKNLVECPLCLQLLPKEKFPVLQKVCAHRSCVDCLWQYFKIEVTESRTNIRCPECSELFHPNDIQAILGNNVLSQKYEEFMLRRVLVADPDVRWCPAPDCGYAVIASGCASCPKLSCERRGCGMSFCYHCKQQWHPHQTCDAARAERAPLNVKCSPLGDERDLISKDDIKPCPRCGAFIVKMDDGSCNHMTCSICGCEFCWLCMQEISDLHYLSPSGCTFWGKKRWSRKKKVLWQLGMLAGAPVGITLVAGVAAPAIIIGLPVWVGKKLYSRHSRTSKHKRNAIVVGGVVGSVLVSPVVAALVIAVGIPILLAYVYGVVPVSLCRSGGCGSGSDADKVKVEFEDANETTNVPSVHLEAEVITIASGRHVANPSIEPSIGEMSLGNSLSVSGSHIDRIGALWEETSDHKSSSQRAVAGESREGSVIDSSYQLVGAASHRLEVRADVVEGGRHRSSVCSDDASVDVRSVTISLLDNASTRALAGSICARDVAQRGGDGASVAMVMEEGGVASPLLSTTTSVSFDDSVPLPSHAGDLIDGSKRRPLVPAEEATSVSSWTDTGSIVSPSLSIDSAYTLGEHHAFPPQSHGAYHQYKYPHYHQQRGSCSSGSSRRGVESEAAHVSIVNERELQPSCQPSAAKLVSTSRAGGGVTAATTTARDAAVALVSPPVPSRQSEQGSQQGKRRSRARSGFPLFVLSGGRSSRQQQQQQQLGRVVHL